MHLSMCSILTFFSLFYAVISRFQSRLPVSKDVHWAKEGIGLNLSNTRVAHIRIHKSVPKADSVEEISKLSQMSHLSWHRDEWCTISPCLTVSNLTQRRLEEPRFQEWIQNEQSRWREPFAPLTFTNHGEIYWYIGAGSSETTLYLRNKAKGLMFGDSIHPLLKPIQCEYYIETAGRILLWHNFWYDNYGHWIHDNAPAIVSLLHIIPDISYIAVPYSEVAESWLHWFDKELFRRTIFYQRDEVICANATMVVPLSRNGNGHNWATPSSIALLNRKAHLLHKTISSRKKIIFTSRDSKTVFHGRKLLNEKQIIENIKKLMAKYKRPEELVIFNGEDVGFEEQFQLFSSASIVIGPHGSAFANILWTKGDYACINPVHTIEFVGGIISGNKVQPPYGVYRGYYDQEASVPWVIYHMLTFQENSTETATSVNIDDVNSVFSYIWGNKSTSANRCFFGLR